MNCYNYCDTVKHIFEEHFLQLMRTKLYYKKIGKKLDELLSPKKAIVITEKDAVKCKDFNLAHAWYLTVDAKLPDSFSQSLLERIAQINTHSSDIL